MMQQSQRSLLVMLLSLVPVNEERSCDEEGRVGSESDTNDERQDKPLDGLATEEEQ